VVLVYIYLTLTSGCAFMIAIRLERCGSSVINHRKSIGFWGGLITRSSGPFGSSIVVLRGDRLEDLPFGSDSAPPKKLKSVQSKQRQKRIRKNKETLIYSPTSSFELGDDINEAAMSTAWSLTRSYANRMQPSALRTQVSTSQDINQITQ